MIPVVFINCRIAPFLVCIMQGLKLYETRTRNTLWLFENQRVYLAETGRGVPVIRCSAIIRAAVPVRSRSTWDALRPVTRVPAFSKYDWTPSTTVKYLYKLDNVRPVPVPFPLPADAVRHGRVWAEYRNEVKIL